MLATMVNDSMKAAVSGATSVSRQIIVTETEFRHETWFLGLDDDVGLRCERAELFAP